MAKKSVAKAGEGLVQALRAASRLYDSGNWEATSAAYQRIVQEHPESGEAWFGLGMLSMRIADYEGAALFFEQAHAAGLLDAACLSNLGEAYRRNGNAEAAIDVLRQACALAPTSFGSCFNLAVVYADAKRFEDALACLERLPGADAKDIRLLVMKGELYKQLSRQDEAVECFEEVLKIVPDSLEALLGLADSRRLQGKYVEAMAAYEAVLKQDPKHLGALNGLAGVAVGLSDEQGAEAFYRQALEVSPECWESLLGLGMELTSRRRFDDAVEVLLRATASHPLQADGWMRLGEAYFHDNRMDEAMAAYRQGVAGKPDHVSSLVGIGNVHVHQGRLMDAVEVYQQACALVPDDYRVLSNVAMALGGYDIAQAQLWAEKAVELAGEAPDAWVIKFNLGAIDLILGNLERGWAGFELRESLRRMGDRFPHPYWQGESLSGKRLLIWQDQGIGDQLLFATIFDEIIREAGEVVIECQPKLLSLTRRSFPAAKVVPRLDKRHPMVLQTFDYQCASGSLPRWRRMSIDRFSGHVATTAVVDPLRADYWRQRLAALSDQPKIGVCWRSSLQTGMRKHCYAALDDWAEVFRVPGICLINLQYDDCQEELVAIREKFGVELVNFPELNMYDDLDETCAMIAQLDAVITAPTAVSRQAGAVGVDTYLLTTPGDWTDLGQTSDPWMRHVLKYRRGHDEPWGLPLARVVADLRERFGLSA